MKTLFPLLSLLACSMFTYAQQDSLSSHDVSEYVVRPNTRLYSKTIEVEIGGKQTRYNTSLSPLLQQGPNFGLYVERMPSSVCISPKFKTLFTSELRVAPMTTIFGGGGMLSLSEKVSYSVLYDFHPFEQFRVYVGGGISGDISVDISQVNSNNTLSPGLDVSWFQATIFPEYVLKTKRRDIKFCDRFSMSLIRTSLLPCYGDMSAFDIKLNAFNYVDFTNRFTVQLPMKRTTLSFSHVLEREKIDRNLVERRRFVSSFAVGFNVFVEKISGRPMKYYKSNGKRIKE
ncbi:MAG: hypothetical protein MJZ19_00415 [Paludibacteraceae bacterium]|nr:hypothetical protein [Paludibacteraceae bacterium]